MTGNADTLAVNGPIGNNYAVNGNLKFTGNSGWYIIETVESFNGRRNYAATGQGSFIQWFSQSAFGGSNYSSTPVAVGAVSHVDEPTTAGVNDTGNYFGRWHVGKNFGCCAWYSRITDAFQMVGDPLVTR